MARGLRDTTRNARFPLHSGDRPPLTFDAPGAKPHRVRNGAFHGPSEHNPTLQLLSNTFGDKLCIELGFTDLSDIDPDIT